MTMIEAGFTPESNGVLAEKLEEVVKKAIRASADDYRVSVLMSCSAFCVPGQQHSVSLV